MGIGKRFDYSINNRNEFDIIDHVESEEKDGICIYNDLGFYPFSSAPALCDLLNNLHDENEELKQIIKDIMYQVEYESSYSTPICKVSVFITPKMYKIFSEMLKTNFSKY